MLVESCFRHNSMRFRDLPDERGYCRSEDKFRWRERGGTRIETSDFVDRRPFFFAAVVPLYFR